MRSLFSVARTALLIVVLSIAGLEVGSRVLDGVQVLATTNFVARDLDRTFNFVANTYDPLLGWRLADDLRAKKPYLTTGRFGVRMNSQEVRQPPRQAILAVGDSFTAGSEVDDSFSWPALLEEELREPVNNAGVGGFGVDQIVLRAEVLVDELEPHTLIVSILSQDSLRNTYSVFGGGAKPYFRLEAGEAVLAGTPVPRTIADRKDIGWLRAVLGHSYLIYAVMTRVGKLPQWVNSRHFYKQIYDNKVGPEISCALMDRLIRLKAARGFRMLLVMQYGGGEIAAGDSPWFATQVVQCARDKGLNLVDTFDHLKSISNSDPEAFKRLYVMHENGTIYGHMSAEGNRVISSMIANQLRATPR